MSVVVAVALLLTGAIGWHIATEFHRRHLRVAHVANIREHLVVWPTADPDLKQPSSAEHNVTVEPPTDGDASPVLRAARCRRTVVLGDHTLSTTVGPRHRRAS